MEGDRGTAAEGPRGTVTRKAISLLSGGLDSTLATKLILDQGIDVVGLHFTSPFASRKERDRGLQAVRTARELGIRLIFLEKGEDFLEVVRSPGHGYGKNMNPCIDCRIYMLRRTRLAMEEEGACFIVSGEVVGQRPMSQMRDTINLIERESGLKDLIVRPLSARLFPPSRPEREGVVDRGRLLGISGRSRKEQNSLAASLGITEFGYPAGGCLLTDPIFAGKLRDLLDHGRLTMREVELLNMGRHFRVDAETKVILGRNREENERLESIGRRPHILARPVGFKGPLALITGPADEAALEKAALLLAHYGKEGSAVVTMEYNNGTTHHISVERRDIDVGALAVPRGERCDS